MGVQADRVSFRQHALSVSLILTLARPFLLFGGRSSSHRSIRPDPIIYRLARVCEFAFGGVGFVSAISQGETDYRRILSRPSAAADFETVFAIGSRQAKCYALVGLRQLNRRRFESFAATLQSSKAEVAVARGCVEMGHPMAEIVNRIRSSVYSGPMTRELIPPSRVTQPRTAHHHEQSWIDRLVGLFSPVGPPLPDPPPHPPGPPPPPPPAPPLPLRSASDRVWADSNGLCP